MHYINRSIHLGLLMAFFTLSACADTPQTSGNQPIKKLESELPEEETEILALKYKGRDTNGRKCDLFIALLEDDHHRIEGHHFLIKVDYKTLDGHRPHAGEAGFYRYDSNTGKYHAADSKEPNTTLSLLALELKDDEKEPEVNKINEYIKKGELEQYLRVELDDIVKFKEFEEKLEEVLEDKSTLDKNKNILDKVDLISMGTAHGDHYHFPTCLKFKVSGVEKTKFELGAHDHKHEDENKP